MVIQSYNITASSQRTFLSAQASTLTATQNQNNSQFSGGSQQVLGAKETADQVAAQQSQSNQGNNGNGQGNNGNGQGQNNGNTGLGQNQNGNGHNSGNGNGNGQSVGNIGLGQNQNSQGQNVNNQEQGNDEVFKNMLRRARDERVEQNNRPGIITRSNMKRGANNTHGLNPNRIPTTPQELRARLSQIIYELLTGRNFKPKQQPPQIDNIEDWRGLDMFSLLGGIFSIGSTEQIHGVEGLRFEHFEMEAESVTYHATGTVLTADGREISIDISTHMSRQFVSYTNISTNTRLVDPLVINYGGTAASLLGEKFRFDLTGDGDLDSIAMLGDGSGFLAIDRNGDGKINDGSELFGPSTGCGFTELRKYDNDGNGWIDANDEIFDKLVVWKRDKDGNDIVYTLKELGIGAIFLGDITTEFSFKDENNETLGVMRSTSFFIKECGGAGTLSHVDMAM